MMRETSPYSTASSADSQRSRSMSAITASNDLPVSREMVRAMRSRALRISCAWIAMSLAGPPAPPLGWWIRKRVLGVQKRRSHQ